MFSINMLNGLFDPIINWISAFLYYVCVGLYYIIICGIGKIIDIIQILFRKFAGIDDLSLAGQEGDIVLQFINSDIVQKVFWSMVVLAVVLLLVASFVAVIKTEFNKDGKNDKKKVIKNAFRGIVNFVAVPIVCIFGLIVGNALIKAVDGALTLTGSSLSMTSQIFVAGGYNANRVRSYETISDNATTYPENSMADYISRGYGNFGIFTDDTTGVAKQSIADKIDSAFANNLTVDLNNLTQDQKTLVYAGGGNGEYAYSYINTFTLGTFPYGHFYFDGTKVEGNEVVIIGDQPDFSPADNNNGKFTFSIYNIGLVSYYYNLSLASYDYLVAGVTLLFAAWVYLTTILGLIKRLFMLTTLFIISPPICALYPLDEGTALGKWRKEFIKQALSAYSVVIVMNIFFLLLPLLLQIEIIPFGEKVQIWDVGVGFVNYIARLLVIIAALLFLKDATKSIAEIIGSESAYDTGSGKASAVASRAVGGALLAGHIANGLMHHKKGQNSGSSSGGEPSQQDIDNVANNDAGKFAGSTNIIDPKNSMYASNTNNLYASGSDNSNSSNTKGTSGSASNNSHYTKTDGLKFDVSSDGTEYSTSLNAKGITDSASENPYSFNAKGITDSASDNSHHTKINDASNRSRAEVSQKAFNDANKELNDKKSNRKEQKKTLKTQTKELNSQVNKATRSSIMNNLKYAGSAFMALATGAKLKDYKSLNKDHSEKQSKVAEDKVKAQKEIEGKQDDFNKQKKDIEDLKNDIKEQKKTVKVLKENAEAAKKAEEDLKKRVEEQKNNKK